MIFFKQRRINKLKIRVAKYKALSKSSTEFGYGQTNTYLMDIYLDHVGNLAEAEAELLILTNGE
jgi:hypothetical protein